MELQHDEKPMRRNAELRMVRWFSYSKT